MENNNIDPWDLVIQNRFSEALAIYLSNYDKFKNGQIFTQIAHMYIIQKNYDEAIYYLEKSLIHTDKKLLSNTHYLYFGICLWNLNKYDEAIKYWKNGLSTPYTDISGGVMVPAILLYSGLKLSDKKLKNYSIKLLNQKCKSYEGKKIGTNSIHTLRNDFCFPGIYCWPGLIAPFLMGMVDENFVSYVIENNNSEQLKNRFNCQFNFYQAVKGLLEQNMEKYFLFMKNCINSKNPLLNVEYYLARWEVENQFPVINLAQLNLTKDF